jgi:pimeloyl-ACP methyl ester carboxylesterase
MMEHIVFVPGVGAREWAWGHQQKYLADIATSEVMVLDQQATRKAMADHVLAHAPERFAIAGHSLGGWVAQEVAARAPERVSSLFLCSTWARVNEGTIDYIRAYAQRIADDYERGLDEHFDQFLYQDRYAEPAFCAWLKRSQRLTPAAAFIRQLEALMGDYSTERLLPQIKADTLVIHGRHDRIIDEGEARFLVDRIPGASLSLIEEAGHCTPFEQPVAFTAAMRLWLERRS